MADGKIFKIFFSGTNGPMALKTDMWHRVFEEYIECSNSGPWLTFSFRQNKIWQNAKI